MLSLVKSRNLSTVIRLTFALEVDVHTNTGILFPDPPDFVGFFCDIFCTVVVLRYCTSNVIEGIV